MEQKPWLSSFSIKLKRVTLKVFQAYVSPSTTECCGYWVHLFRPHSGKEKEKEKTKRLLDTKRNLA